MSIIIIESFSFKTKSNMMLHFKRDRNSTLRVVQLQLIFAFQKIEVCSFKRQAFSFCEYILCHVGDKVLGDASLQSRLIIVLLDPFKNETPFKLPAPSFMIKCDKKGESYPLFCFIIYTYIVNLA